MKNVFNLILGLLLTGLLFSCSESDTTTEPTVVEPKIIKLSPLNNATKVNSSQTFQIEFDKIVKSGSGSILLYLKSNDNLVETLDVTKSVTFNDKTLTFTFTKKLDLGTQYYILIDDGALLFENTNKYSGIGDKSIWTFTTKSILEQDNIVSAVISGAVNRTFVSDPSSYYTRAFEGVEFNYVEGGQSYSNDMELNQVKIYYPFNYTVDTEFDLSTSNQIGFYFGTFSVKTEYYIDEGTMKLTKLTSEYVEGTFNFKATSLSGSKVTVKNGYFFVKF